MFQFIYHEYPPLVNLGVETVEKPPLTKIGVIDKPK